MGPIDSAEPPVPFQTLAQTLKDNCRHLQFVVLNSCPPDKDDLIEGKTNVMTTLD